MYTLMGALKVHLGDWIGARTGVSIRQLGHDMLGLVCVVEE